MSIELFAIFSIVNAPFSISRVLRSFVFDFRSNHYLAWPSYFSNPFPLSLHSILLHVHVSDRILSLHKIKERHIFTLTAAIEIHSKSNGRKLRQRRKWQLSARHWRFLAMSVPRRSGLWRILVDAIGVSLVGEPWWGCLKVMDRENEVVFRLL